jgi:arylsulfatase A-like enzyme
MRRLSGSWAIANPRQRGRCRRTLAFAALLGALPALACAPAPQEPASIILVVIDTLRRDHLGLYGYERATSPGLDRLAGESAVFERCIATSSWTKPSTVSLLSGLYPPGHGVHQRAKAPAEITFVSEILRDHGFATAAFSGNVHVSPTFGMAQGFDHFRSARIQGTGTYPEAADLLDAALGWLGEHPDEPSFLYVHLMNVHGPYRSTDEQRRRFVVEPRSRFEFKNELWTRIMRDGDLAARSEVSEAHLNDLRGRYDAAVAHTDAALATFLDTLAADGTLDRTLLVVTSDHGEELFEHGGFGHRRTLYGEVVEIPLLIRDPDRSGAPTRIATPVSLVDIPATILDWAGLSGAEESFADGRSLLPLMRGEAAGADFADRLLIAELDEGETARVQLVQRGSLRLVGIQNDYRGRTNEIELFDIEADPHERVDLSGERPDELRELLRSGRPLLDGTFVPTRPEPAVIDDDLEKRLKALGYAD